MRGALPQVSVDAGTHRGGKTKQKGGPAKGLLSASKAAFKTNLGKASASAQARAKGSFAAVLHSKLDAESGSVEKLRKSAETAIKSIKGEKLPVSVFEKALREIMEDGKLDPRQKAARLKRLLAGLREGQAPGMEGQRLSVNSATAESARKDAQARENAPIASADATRKTAGPRLYVLDLRKNASEKKPGTGSESKNGTERPGGMEKTAREPFFTALKAAADREQPQAPRASAAPRPGASMTPIERLREMAGSELARAAGIILRDGGSGEIRLVLKPESLGSVRVRLNLSDNVIDGKIFVDNPEVKHVLEGSIDSLTRALSADGFQTASLQVSVSGNGGEDQRRDREPLAVARIETERGFDGAVAEMERFTGWDDLLVNLFA